MPQIRYVGPFDEVVLPTLDIETVRGGVVDVDDESFANLVLQHDWEAVDAAPVVPEPELVADAAPVDPEPELVADAAPVENGTSE